MDTIPTQTKEEIKNEYTKDMKQKLDKKIYDVIDINDTLYIVDPVINHVYNINNELVGIKYDTRIIFFKEINDLVDKSNKLFI